MGEDVQEGVSDPLAFRELMSDAIRYWEPRRLVYNGALAVVVLVCFALQWPSAWARLTFPTVLVVFIFAVLANVAYCTAYVVDIPMQYSSVRREWLKRRWYVLVTGTLFASAITYLMAYGLFFPAE